MPIFDYTCLKCGNQADDELVKTADEEVICAHCNSVMTKLMPAAAFKINDYMVTRHKRKYGNSNEVVPKSPNNGVRFGTTRRK